jgi:hypothetical protein
MVAFENYKKLSYGVKTNCHQQLLATMDVAYKYLKPRIGSLRSHIATMPGIGYGSVHP